MGGSYSLEINPVLFPLGGREWAVGLPSILELAVHLGRPIMTTAKADDHW